MRAIIISFIILLLACKSANKRAESVQKTAGDEKGYGLEFGEDYSLDSAFNSLDTTIWNGSYAMVVNIPEGKKLLDSSGAITLKQQGTSVTRSAQLFGDYRNDEFFKDKKGLTIISRDIKGWTYTMVNDSTLTDSNGNEFVKIK